MHALEVFLTQHPEWIGKVVLVQLAVPSRQDVEEYQNLRSTVNELVGRINGRFGTVDFMPIHFMHKSLPFAELCALYAVSDVCLVSSTRDGMNLVYPFENMSIYLRILTVCFLFSQGFVRVYCVSAEAQWCNDPQRVCWRGPKSQRLDHRQSMGQSAGCGCHFRSGDDVARSKTREPEETVQGEFLHLPHVINTFTLTHVNFPCDSTNSMFKSTRRHTGERPS
jgi:hypothetical protein